MNEKLNCQALIAKDNIIKLKNKLLGIDRKQTTLTQRIIEYKHSRRYSILSRGYREVQLHLSRNEVFGVILLLTEGFVEGRDTTNDSNSHESK